MEHRLAAILLVSALASGLLAGCSAQTVSAEHPELQVPDRTAAIAVGVADRAAVRAALGVPVSNSARWRFDLFRASTEQTATLWAVTPLPVPAGWMTDEIQRYTLVGYGEDGRVAAVASGVFRKPADWRNISPIAHDFPALHLRTDDVLFFVDPEGARGINLLAAPAGRDRFLAEARAAPHCTVVLGCSGGGCPDRSALDGGTARRLPLRTAHAYWIEVAARERWLEGIEPAAADAREPWLEALVALDLAPGEHTLELSAAHFDGSGTTRVACRAGVVSYLVVSARAYFDFWEQTLSDWRIEQSADLPAAFARRPLVLMDDGEWLVTRVADD